MPLLFTAAATVSLSAAWIFPGTVAAVLFGWTAALCISRVTLKSSRPFLHSFIIGSLSFGAATRWIYSTIQDFGGFGPLPSGVLSLLFFLASGLQFPLFIFFHRCMPAFLKRMGFSCAAAWVSAEFIFPGLFPWHMAHTQLAFVPFIQISSIAGSQTISFVMLWVAESLVEKRSAGMRIPPLLAFMFSIAYGLFCMHVYKSTPSPAHPVAVIQANISVDDKHDVKMFRTNVDRYIEMSRAVPDTGALIIWPESVITEPVSDFIQDVTVSETLNSLPMSRPYLVGVITYQSKTRYFNSALGIQQDGKVLNPYHKRILMPFGEFTPFSEIFPWLRDINSTAGDFTPGIREKVFTWRIAGKDGTETELKASPLICYEDLVPSMARDSVRAGAALLINLTNDAWYGRSAAPFQHHVIASFRAVENRRFLVRSTNTGFSAVVDPLGRTVDSIPIFSEGTVLTSVRLLSEKTLYSSHLSNFPIQLLFGLICVGILYRALLSAMPVLNRILKEPAKK